MKEEKMKIENTNKEIVKKYFDSLSSGDFTVLEEIFAKDIIWHQPGLSPLSKSYFGVKEVFNLFTDFMTISQGTFKIYEVKSIMINNDLVTTTLSFSAFKNGKSISMEGVDIMKIQNGQIKEVWLFSSDQKAEDSFWTQ